MNKNLTQIESEVEGKRKVMFDDRNCSNREIEREKVFLSVFFSSRPYTNKTSTLVFLCQHG
jgi:hypothetical protein